MTAVADWFRAHDVDPAAVEAWHADPRPYSHRTPILMWAHAGGTGHKTLTHTEYAELRDAEDSDRRAAR